MTQRLPILMVLFFIFSLEAYAKETLCHGHFVNPIQDVCWSCLFPLSLGDIAVVKGKEADTHNPSMPLCSCPGKPIPRIGITMGYWEPVRLVDVTRTPFCMVNLGGLQLPFGHYFGKGFVDKTELSEGSSFYYVHWYQFPLLAWLNLLTDIACVETGDFDIAYLTELDPLWRDDELNFIINPEAILFASTAAQAACAADSMAATKHLGIDKLFWCAGAQGSMYPLTGHVSHHVSGVQASTLLTERMTFKLHRQGLMRDTVAKNGLALCRPHVTLIMPKSRYRYQMTNPIPAAREPTGCKPFGHTTATWGVGREFPFKGEDFGYLVWRKRNCCAF